MKTELTKVWDKTYGPAQVIMLPTERNNEIGQIVKRPSDGALAIINVLTKDDPQECINQHFYIITSEEIKKANEWYYNTNLNSIGFDSVFTNSGLANKNKKKIIASTDKSLNVARPSDEFIKKFCELNGEVKDVFVEYEFLEPTKYVNEDEEVIEDYPFGLKVAPDNTISIIIL